MNNNYRKAKQPYRGFRNNLFETLLSRLPKISRENRNLSWRISTRSYIQKFGLKFREANRISYFIYMVNGEEDRTFLNAMETWVREVALVTGTAREVIDAISILSVCRIDMEKIRTCRTVRREVTRYVRSKFMGRSCSIGKTAMKEVPAL